MMLREFATPAFPLHASAIPDLMRCNLRTALLVTGQLVKTDNFRKAAETGEAVHAAVAAWHKNNRHLANAIKAMKEGGTTYPLADLDDAEKHFRLYAADPRNIEAEVVLVEARVSFSLSPSPEDPTGEPIEVSARLDQVRRDGATLKLWDVKHVTETDAYVLSHKYAYQLAAYCYGAALKLGRTVEPGGFIRTRAYVARKHTNVFIEAAWTADALPVFLDGVRRAVARVRAGLVDPNPGEHCGFCPAVGLHSCIPELQNMRVA